MKSVREVLASMQSVELNALAIGEVEHDDLRENEVRKFINITNIALLDLFTKFNISTDSVIVMTDPNRDMYLLQNGEPNLVLSPGEEFPNNVITLKAVYDEVGNTIPINDTSSDRSSFTPSPNVIQLPSDESAKAYEIVYQARHPKLLGPKELSISEVLDQEINIPLPLEEPLTTKIASYYFKSLAGDGNSARAKELSETYEIMCIGLKSKNILEYESADISDKLEQKGFP